MSYLSKYQSENGWWKFYKEAELYFPSVDIGGITIFAIFCVPFLFNLFMKDEIVATLAGLFFAGLIHLAARVYNDRQSRCAARLADEKFRNSKHHF
jgi:hypothetical protein